MCVGFGNATNRLMITMEVRLLGHEPRSIKNLSESAAVQQGADLISEMFIFSVAVAVMSFEYTRSQIASANAKEAKETRRKYKEKVRNLRFEALEDRNELILARLDRIDKALGLPPMPPTAIDSSDPVAASSY